MYRTKLQSQTAGTIGIQREPLVVFNWIPDPGADGEWGRWGNTYKEATVSTRNLVTQPVHEEQQRWGQRSGRNWMGTLWSALVSLVSALAMVLTLWVGRRVCWWSWTAGSSMTRGGSCSGVARHERNILISWEEKRLHGVNSSLYCPELVFSGAIHLGSAIDFVRG